MLTATAKAKRIHKMARSLYLSMPGAPFVGTDDLGDGNGHVRMWGEVEGNEHYQFCEHIATMIASVDTRVHIERD